MDSSLQLDFVSSEWGKNRIKVLVVKKEEKIHSIKELEICSALSLKNHRDYIFADNSEVIATDSQKNTIHVLAKQHNIQNIENFAMLLCEHFLRKYPQLSSAKIHIKEQPWKRIEISGEKHVHAFQHIKDCVRICEVSQQRDEKPTICSGIRNLRVLKTTNSAFKGFVDDEYRTLPYSDDRIFSSVITANWWYSYSERIDFNETWHKVKGAILEGFAGPADKGVLSANVESTLYKTAETILSTFSQINQIELNFPNKHYFEIDFSKFHKLSFESCYNRVYTAMDNPSGNIRAVLKRRNMSKL